MGEGGTMTERTGNGIKGVNLNGGQREYYRKMRLVKTGRASLYIAYHNSVDSAWKAAGLP